MPNQLKSPYAPSFKAAIKRGTPASIAVAGIAKRYNKPIKTVFASLHRAELCHRQKFNGQWLYWPYEAKRGSSTDAKACQLQIWQSLVDWSIATGNCKPQQLENYSGSQQEFMSYCRRFFNRQVSGSTSGSSRSPKRAAASSRKPSTTARVRKSSSASSRKSRPTSYTRGRECGPCSSA